MTRRGAVLLVIAALATASGVARAEQAVDDETAAQPAAAEEGGEQQPAAEAGEQQPAAETGETGEDADAQAFLSGHETEAAPEIAAPEQERGIGREEPPDMHFWEVGARWRMIMVPRWLLNAFFDFPGIESGAQLPRSVIVNQAAGGEFTWRHNRLSIIGAIWWAGYYTQSQDTSGEATDGWFVANESGTTDDPEFIRSRISLLLFTVSFMHSYMFTDWVGITYGGSVGLGINLHSDHGTGLYRHEAEGSGSPYARCESASGGLCESEGYYYPAQEDDVWRAYPWIDLMLGLRFKPFRHMEIDVEGGAGLGFLFGLRVNYIF
jgi:hypothetical protein